MTGKTKPLLSKGFVKCRLDRNRTTTKIKYPAQFSFNQDVENDTRCGNDSCGITKRVCKWYIDAGTRI
jgi:hypothetical protein